MTISGMDITCPKCGSDDVIGMRGANSAKIVCNECGHTGTACRDDGDGGDDGR
jgi:Zn ribbon nucleic-acid-binding protein